MLINVLDIQSSISNHFGSYELLSGVLFYVSILLIISASWRLLIGVQAAICSVIGTPTKGSIRKCPGHSLCG
jgi:hypothetical protein